MSGGSFDAIITNGMASIRQAADATGRAVGGLRSGVEQLGGGGEKAFSKIGGAISKMGGPLGDLGGKFFGAAGMEGGLARIALVAVAAGIAFRTITAAMDASKARTEALVAATSKLEAAYRNAGKAKDSFAIGSADTGRAKAVAENLFGHRAGDVAENLANEFKVELGDVLKAMANTGAIPRDQRMAAIRAALGVAASGEATASDAVGRLSDRATRERVFGQHGRTVAGIPIGDEHARSAVLLQAMRGGNGEDAWIDAVEAVGGRQGASGGQLAGLAAAGSIVTRGQVQAFDTGATTTALERRNNLEVNPVLKAFKEWSEAQDIAIRDLIESHKKSSLFVEGVSEFLSAYGLLGAKSYARQANEAARNKINAIEGTQLRGSGK